MTAAQGIYPIIRWEQYPWNTVSPAVAQGAIVGTAEGIKAARKAGENPWALTEEDLCSQQSSLPLKSLGAKAKASRLHTESKPTTAQELGIEKEVERIKNGVRYKYAHDSSPYYNSEGIFPTNTTYKEYYTTPVGNPGTSRIVVGNDGRWYYTPDHYETIIPFKP